MLSLDEITLQTVFVALLMILPGFISMRVYSLIRPGNQPTLKDTLFEALAYGSINLGLMSWAVFLFFTTENLIVRSGLAAITLAIAPVAWPFVLDGALNKLAKLQVIPYRHKTGWDAFFLRRQECWIIIHLIDGTRVGGRFSENSYVTVTPTPGHLYLEELWAIDQETGTFGDSKVSDGIILKPSDYKFIEIKQIVT